MKIKIVRVTSCINFKNTFLIFRLQFTIISIRYKDLLLILAYSLTHLITYSLMLKLYEIHLPILDNYWGRGPHYIHSFHSRYHAVCKWYHHFLSKFQAKYQNYFIVLSVLLVTCFESAAYICCTLICRFWCLISYLGGEGRQHINQIFA